MEIELKLRVDPQDIARLRGVALFKKSPRTGPRKFHNVYYDTPDGDLAQARVSLRVRRVGKSWLQTVKSGASSSAGLSERNEFEAPIAGPGLDFGRLDEIDEPIFASARLRANLAPVFTTEYTRTSWTLTPEAGVVIEASIDCGAVRCGDAEDPISELELEVISGPGWRAYQIAMQLLAEVRLLVEDRTKSERGNALLRGDKPAAVKPLASSLTPPMSANDAFKTLVYSCLTHFLANQRGMLDGSDPEYLHQMRVALRRLRSIFDTFDILFPENALAEPDAETRWLGSLLGEARDWDVFFGETLPEVMKRYSDHPGMVELEQSASRLRRNTNRAAREAVASARAQGLLLGLGGWLSAETWLTLMDETQKKNALSQPVPDFARDRLDAARTRLLKRGRGFERLSPSELHRLRIAAKKLRYAIEFFTPLYAEQDVREFRESLVDLQECLGAYNDAATVERIVEDAGHGLTTSSAMEARGILLGWSANTQRGATRNLKRLWKKARTAKPFWE